MTRTFDYDDFGNLRSWQPPQPAKRESDALQQVLERAAQRAEEGGAWLPKQAQNAKLP